MRQQNQNRMAQHGSTRQEERQPRPPLPEPTPPVVVPADPVPTVVQCPSCGAARMNQWEHRGQGRGVPYRRCRACGKTFAFTATGLRQVG